jgi:gliding motility-associated-like protein
VVGAGASGDVLVQNSAGSDTEPGFLYKVVELKFDGNTLDNTDANRDASIVGTATYGTGASGQAICFTNNNVVNGTTVQNYLTLPSDLIRGRGSNFTVSLRFKTNSFGGILGYQNAAVGSGSRTQWVPILYVQSDGKLNANLWQGSVLNVTSTNRVDDGNWHKVEFSAAPGSITVYIDGVLAGTSTGTIDHLSMSFNQLGAVTTEGVWTGDPIDGWFGFNGCIDEFVIIDRSLTASQIQQVTQLPLPTITSFSPTTAKSGETITITGTNLGSASSVRIGGVEARSISVVSATEIRVIVPRNPTLNNSIVLTTAAGTTSATSFTFDCTNLALDFDATNDHVVIGDKIENLGAFSQEAWVYWKGSSHPDYYNEIFTKDYISALAITNANELHANFGDGTSWGSGLNSRTLIPLNTWTHVAVTRSANGLVKMYINGVLDANSAILNKTGANAAIRAIGAKPFGNIRYGHFNGAIDELKVWNTERTAQQIQIDLTDEAVGNETDLIAYYNFNQGTAEGNNSTITTLNNLTPAVSLSATLTNFQLTGVTSNFVQGVWPVITVQPIATRTVCSGNVAGLSTTAAGPQLTYQWYTNTTASNTGGTAITGANAATYTFTSSTVGTQYFYVVVNGACSRSTTSSVSVVNTIAIPVISYASSYSFERTNAINNIAPTSSGAVVASYSISPALPQGLSFNTTTGVISGTPAANSTARSYTVTGNAASGCTGSASFNLEVFSAVAPSELAYTPASQTVRQGTAITAMVPSASGGVIASYSISPALPAGLTFNTATGEISGTLTAAQTGTVNYTITATNSGGSTTATVTLIFNTAPTDLALNTTSVAENAASATTVGTLSATDADAGDTFTYSLVSGTGDADNASFSIAGSSLNTAAVFDFETKSSYSVRVRVTDAGGLSFEKAITISVTNVNEAPTDVAANANSVAENAASGTSVATMSATDVDAGDTFTYSLVAGTGDADNASFTIDGATLKTAGVFDFETKSSYSVRVRVTDAGGLTFEKVFTIGVTDVNEAPTALALSNTSVLENAASGTTVGTLAGTDADAGDTHTYTLVTGTGSTDNASFTITGTTLSTAAVFNFEAKNSYAVRVRVTDAGGLSFERAFTITVTDVNEAPTLTAITDRRVYNVSTSQVVNLAGITAGPETAQTTTTSVSTSNPAAFSAINVVGTQIQFTLAAGIATPQDVVVTVRVRDNGGVANGGVDSVVRTFRLGIDPMPVAAASPNLITLGATAQLSATGANAVNYTWVAVGGTGIVGSGATINVRPAGTTTYAVVVTNSFGYQATVPVLLTVIVDYKLVPNNLVTPNGDGVNDRWVIPNIDMYPDNEVMVYDKAGRAVFAKRGYNNEWDGTVNGKKLKEDAYFYVIKFNKDGALPIRGYVSIVR